MRNAAIQKCGRVARGHEKGRAVTKSTCPPTHSRSSLSVSKGKAYYTFNTQHQAQFERLVIKIKGMALKFGSICFAISCTVAVLQASVSGQTVNARLDTFQKFVNGEVPIKEAIVYRKLSKTDGRLLNQEWWRFGCQEGTWYVQRLIPDKQDPSKLVASGSDAFGTVGESFTHAWVVSDKDIHIVDKISATGSTPDTFGALERSLMFCALSLGLPRLPGMHEIEDAQITWDDLAFTTTIARKSDKIGAVLVTNDTTITGTLSLDTNGKPTVAEFHGVGGFPSGSVHYEYKTADASIPTVFLVRFPDEVFEFQFLSLTLGTNDLTETGGYVPSLFADMKVTRNITVWTNSLPYTLLNGKTIPAFETPHPKRAGPIILISLAVVSTLFLVLWYRRAGKPKYT